MSCVLVLVCFVRHMHVSVCVCASVYDFLLFGLGRGCLNMVEKLFGHVLSTVSFPKPTKDKIRSVCVCVCGFCVEFGRINWGALVACGCTSELR